KRHRREDRRRRTERRVHAGSGEDGDGEEDRGPALARQAADHGPAATGVPSGSPTCPDTITRVPAAMAGAAISVFPPCDRPGVIAVQCALPSLPTTATRAAPVTS